MKLGKDSSITNKYIKKTAMFLNVIKFLIEIFRREIKPRDPEAGTLEFN